jgi:oligosaccharide reducing-end xylanase
VVTRISWSRSRSLGERTVRALAVLAIGACTSSVDSLGYEDVDAGIQDSGGMDVPDPPDADMPDADMPDADMPDADMPDADMPDATGEGGAGGQGPTPPTLTPLVPPMSYPNPFGELLGKTEEEITDKIEAAFQQLFYGGVTQIIYYPVDDDESEIRDIYHGDVRTEGIGLAMLIAVQLDKQEEFERLWRHAKTAKAATGDDAGYFLSKCDTVDGTRDCLDPFGYQQFAMALIFAHNRWGSDGTFDYEADALALLDVMRNKSEMVGPGANVTNTFDTETKLVFDEPRPLIVHTRPSLEMPAYYELWAQATGDDFWRDAAAAGRSYISRVAHATTGLTPVRAYFNGDLMDTWRNFDAESYRTHLNLALDHIWVGTTALPVDYSNRIIRFFSGMPIATPHTEYELDGTPLDMNTELALLFANGIAAVAATDERRIDFVQTVWNQGTPSGPVRYYAGLMDLLALMILGGRMHVI